MTDTVQSTTTRKILRFPLDERGDDNVATIVVGANAKLVHVGVGTSPRICAWVEVDAIEATAIDESIVGVSAPADEMLRFAFIGTGDVVPEGAEYVAFTYEAGPTGIAIRHVLLLP